MIDGGPTANFLEYTHYLEQAIITNVARCHQLLFHRAHKRRQQRAELEGAFLKES